MIAKSLRPFCFLFLISRFLFADGIGTSTGTLVGIAQDELGTTLPAVLITLEGLAGIKNTTSDTKGEFVFAFLTPGIYTLRAELQDFTTLEQVDLQIRSGQKINLLLKMKPQVHEQVSVIAETPLVDRTNTTTITNISNQLTEVLPLKRSLGDIIKMAPGVVDGRVGGANLSISGASGWENTFLVNGINISNPGYGGLGTNNLHFFMSNNGLPLESILETQIITAGFEPEYGESQGGVINIITKSGGNQFHGSAHFYTIPQAEQTILSGVNYEIESGAEIGGPILKNKLFFHGAYTLTASKSTNFLDPEFPGYSVLPEFPEKSYNNAYSVKISGNPTANHSLEFSTFGSPTYLPLALHGWQVDSAVNPKMAESEWHFGNSSQQLRWNGTLTRNFFMEAQLGRSYDQFVFKPTPLSDNVPRIRDFTHDPPLDIGGFGGDTNFYDTNWQYGLKFTNLWNYHQFRYGLQFEDIEHSEVNRRSGSVFTFPDGSVAQGGYVILKFADDFYLVNAVVPVVATQSSTKYVYSFVQDSWDITSRFNINLGLRWEQQILKEDREKRRVNFGNNWAPRIGMTCDYLNNGSSKLFFHYGRFYERLPNYAAAYLSTFFNATAAFSDIDLTQLIGQDPITHNAYFAGRGSLEFEGHENSTSPFVTKLAYTNEWSGGIEQEFQNGFHMRANVIFRRLERALDTVGLDRDLHCEPVSATTCYPPPQTLENWLNGAGSLFLFTNVDGHIPGIPALERNYASLQISAEKRFSDRWQMLGSYTYAKLTGNYNGDDRSGVADFAVSAMAPFNYDIGPLPNDIRHAVKFFGSYQLQNFNAGVAFDFQTGRPITKLRGVGQDFFGFVTGVIPQEPRGASGRTDSVSSVDLHAEYNLPGFQDQRITIGADIFNVFNSQSVLAVEEVEASYYFDNRVTDPNPNFLEPAEIQGGRYIRLLFRYTF